MDKEMEQIRYCRFCGMSDKIEYYLDLFERKRTLNKVQIDDLKNTAITIACNGWAGEQFYLEVRAFLKVNFDIDI